MHLGIQDHLGCLVHPGILWVLLPLVGPGILDLLGCLVHQGCLWLQKGIVYKYQVRYTYASLCCVCVCVCVCACVCVHMIIELHANFLYMANPWESPIPLSKYHLYIIIFDFLPSPHVLKTHFTIYSYRSVRDITINHLPGWPGGPGGPFPPGEPLVPENTTKICFMQQI